MKHRRAEHVTAAVVETGTGAGDEPRTRKTRPAAWGAAWSPTSARTNEQTNCRTTGCLVADLGEHRWAERGTAVVALYL